MVPASTKIMSPACTGSSCSNASNDSFPSASRTISRVVPGFTPSDKLAPGAASSTYQHSVLPRAVPPSFAACASSGCTCTDSLSSGKSIFTSSGNSSRSPSKSAPKSFCISASDFPADGSVSTLHCSPVSQASPTAWVTGCLYHGARSSRPHTRSEKKIPNRNGSNFGSIIVIVLLLRVLFEQHRRHRRIALRVLPQDHVQLHHRRPVRVRKIHLRRSLRANRARFVRRVDQPVVAVRRVRRKRRLISRPRKQRRNHRRESVVVVHRWQAQQRLHRPQHAHGRVEAAVHKRLLPRLRMRRVLADDYAQRAVRVDVVGAVLRIVFENEERRIVPIGRVRNRLHSAANREIVVGHRRLRRRPARRR